MRDCQINNSFHSYNYYVPKIVTKLSQVWYKTCQTASKKSVTPANWESRILQSWLLHPFSEVSKIISDLKKTEVKYKTVLIIYKNSPCNKVMLQLLKYWLLLEGHIFLSRCWISCPRSAALWRMGGRPQRGGEGRRRPERGCGEAVATHLLNRSLSFKSLSCQFPF